MKSLSSKRLLLYEAFAVSIFVAAAYIANQPATNIEISVFRAIFNIPEAWLPIFKFLTYAGTLGVFIALLVLTIKKRNWLRLSLAIPGIASAYGATYYIKEQLVSRARPPELLGIVPRDELDTIARDGFPSGHVAVAALLTVLLLHFVPYKWRYWLLVIPLLVGVGRVYVGEHMPLDVVGGMCIGILIGILSELLMRNLPSLLHSKR